MVRRNSTSGRASQGAAKQIPIEDGDAETKAQEASDKDADKSKGATPPPPDENADAPAGSSEEPAPAESDEPVAAEMSIELEPDQPTEPAADGQAATEAPATESPAEGQVEGAEGEAVEAQAEPAEEAGPSVEDLTAQLAEAQEQLEAAQAETKDWQDRFLRLQAEWDTYRRRTNEQREAEKALASEKLVTNMLPIIDDFERAIDYAEKNGEADLLGGVKAVHTKLLDVLGKDGVTVINPVGQPFDAMEQQAVSIVPDDSQYDETVADVYQRGYKMGKKVLRPAMVVVTTGGPERPKEETTEEEK